MDEKEEGFSKSRLEVTMHDVAQLISEEIAMEEEKYTDDMESYAYRLRSNFYHDASKFQHRFVKGYNTLLEILDKSAL